MGTIGRCTMGVLLVLSGTNALAASFDCRQAATRVEKLICGNPALSSLDDQLNASFGTAMASSPPADLKQQQRAWLKRRSQCATASCLADMYRSRIISIYMYESQPLAINIRARQEVFERCLDKTFH